MGIGIENRILLKLCLIAAGQRVLAPGELGGAASDGLDSNAGRHHAQRLHAGHPRRPPGRQDCQAQLLRWRHLVSSLVPCDVMAQTRSAWMVL